MPCCMQNRVLDNEKLNDSNATIADHWFNITAVGGGVRRRIPLQFNVMPLGKTACELFDS